MAACIVTTILLFCSECSNACFLQQTTIIYFVVSAQMRVLYNNNLFVVSAQTRVLYIGVLYWNYRITSD